MPIASKATYGLCKLKGCRVRFRKKNKRQTFCSTAHKEAFYRRGQFPFDRMADEIMKRVVVELDPLRARVSELEGLLTEARAESSRALRVLASVASSVSNLADRDHAARALNAGGGVAA